MQCSKWHIGRLEKTTGKEKQRRKKVQILPFKERTAGSKKQ